MGGVLGPADPELIPEKGEVGGGGGKGKADISFEKYNGLSSFRNKKYLFF